MSARRFPEMAHDLGGTTSSSTHALPDDLIRQASRRLGIAALVWVFLWSLGLVLNNVVAPIISPGAELDDAWPWPGNPIAAVSIVISGGLFAYTRWRGCNCRGALDLGLVHEVLIAFAIGLVNQWTPNTVGLSWICILVVTYPVIVPNTAGKTFVAAMIAASMDLVGLAVTAARGVEIPATSVIVWANLPNYVCAGLAVLPSRIITRLGHQVSRARQLGSYQLTELLGRGGMGEVYRATHRMLARPAAIKLIRPEVLGRSSPRGQQVLVERFRREANAAAMLRSPHTIGLYDFGVAADGTFFYVMELLEGIDLQSLVERFGPLPAERAIWFLRQACESLAEAHAAGMVHRDIKPANIQACRLGMAVDFIKVLDFGLVSLERGEAAEETGITATGLAACTPAFAAPEIVDGPRSLDRRADIYALGCVAYWLLTGTLVFEAATPTKMLLQHMQSPPEPPSSRSELDVPAKLDRIVLACLAKNPDDRPSDASLLSEQLAACEVSEPWTDERGRAWWAAHLPAPQASVGGESRGSGGHDPFGSRINLVDSPRPVASTRGE